MIIPVVGIDPSLRNWGIAEARLDLTTGYLDSPNLTLVQPKETTGKQVRKNSKDLELAEQIAEAILPIAKNAKAVFVEVPVGSQSARSMASYGICVGVLGTLKALNIPLIEVSPTEVKLAFTNNRNATKQDMIDEAVKQYPQANFLTRGAKLTSKNEHVADAIAAIHAGVRTPLFKNILKLYMEN